MKFGGYIRHVRNPAKAGKFIKLQHSSQSISMKILHVSNMIGHLFHVCHDLTSANHDRCKPYSAHIVRSRRKTVGFRGFGVGHRLMTVGSRHFSVGFRTYFVRNPTVSRRGPTGLRQNPTPKHRNPTGSNGAHATYADKAYVSFT